jgi:hypothetical protein
MPKSVDHVVLASKVRPGDVFSTDNAADVPYGATVDLVKNGSVWTYLYGPQHDAPEGASKVDVVGRELLLKRHLLDYVTVVRQEPTDEELAETERRHNERFALELIDELESALPKARAAFADTLANDQVPSDGQLVALLRGARAAPLTPRGCASVSASTPGDPPSSCSRCSRRT